MMSLVLKATMMMFAMILPLISIASPIAQEGELVVPVNSDPVIGGMDPIAVDGEPQLLNSSAEAEFSIESVPVTTMDELNIAEEKTIAQSEDDVDASPIEEESPTEEVPLSVSSPSPTSALTSPPSTTMPSTTIPPTTTMVPTSTSTIAPSSTTTSSAPTTTAPPTTIPTTIMVSTTAPSTAAPSTTSLPTTPIVSTTAASIITTSTPLPSNSESNATVSSMIDVIGAMESAVAHRKSFVQFIKQQIKNHREKEERAMKTNRDTWAADFDSKYDDMMKKEIALAKERVKMTEAAEALNRMQSTLSRIKRNE